MGIRGYGQQARKDKYHETHRRSSRAVAGQQDRASAGTHPEVAEKADREREEQSGDPAQGRPGRVAHVFDSTCFRPNIFPKKAAPPFRFLKRWELRNRASQTCHWVSI